MQPPNHGCVAVDGETFATIEDHGLEPWLQRLRQEMRTKQYRCAPLLRVGGILFFRWIVAV